MGEWRNDCFTGWGREKRKSSRVSEGKYIDGLIRGKRSIKNNLRHGKGILETKKIYYKGEFKNDKLCGKGRITFKLEGHVYEGDFDDNGINGFGIFKLKNGDNYIGFFCNGKMHGKGKYIYNSELVYEGNYNNGVKEGKEKCTIWK